jgi:hypothetical protein
MKIEKIRPRTVVTTDGEVDDMNSMLRQLLYTNDMDLAGIVLTSSTYHYAGNGKDIEPYRWTGTKWLYDFLEDYESVYENLKAHDENYPDPAFLKSHSFIGNISNVGEMDEVTPGSQFLKQLFLDNDPRTLYVQTWGGTNTTARALKSIQEEYENTDQWEEIQKKIYEKVVLYIILDQDDSYETYIAKVWPQLQILNDCSNFWHFAYAWQLHSDELNDTLHAPWFLENIVKGEIGKNYALIGDGRTVEGELDEEQRGWDSYLQANPNYVPYDFISEGDTPSFMYLVDVGLRSLEDPGFGGWGGRFGKVDKKTYKNIVADYNPYAKRYEANYSLTRWMHDFNYDFANKIAWTLSKEGGHYRPEIEIEPGLDLKVQPGQKVTLKAIVKDKQNLPLTCSWWRYFEADTYMDSDKGAKLLEQKIDGLLMDLVGASEEAEGLDSIKIEHPNAFEMSFTVPEDGKPGQSIHMICEVRNPYLVSYARIICTIDN